MWGSRVIIPPKYQEQLLEQLHEGHREIVRMKALARSYIWWPGWTGKSSKQQKDALAVNSPRTILRPPHFMHGSGQHAHGNAST